MKFFAGRFGYWRSGNARSGKSARNSLQRRSYRRRLQFEGLEPRLPFTANAAFNLNAAIEAGMANLESILDPTSGQPYFQTWTLTQAQSIKDGDTSAHPSTASMVGDQHFVSNVSGRALYALMLGSEVTGASIIPGALSDYETDVLKSLFRPRDGNWSNTAPANQEITGLAADPEAFGSQQFDFTYLFNMGAGARGALALATLAANPNAILPGYNVSASALMETIIYNIRAYYVYDGTIGGTRVYSWENFREQLGLQGGNVIAGSTKTEKQSNWSNLDKNWVDPFLLDAIVRYYQATGSPNALALAEELRDYDFYQRFPLDPAAVPIKSFTHMFEVTAEMDAYSRLALVLNDADMMKRVQVRYEALRGTVFSSTGWVPETYGSNSDVGEINDTAELIDTALNFAQFGWTQYYNDVERFTRGQLLPSQLMDTSYVTPNAHPIGNAQSNIATRAIGAFGFPAPYGYVATKNPYSSGGFFSDVTAGGVVGLADVENAVYSYTGGVHTINLLFDYSNDDISIVSPYTNPAGERLSIVLKAAGDVRIRLPSWADQTAIGASLAQQGLSYTFENGYVHITGAPVGTAFYVAMPLAMQTATDTVNGRKISILWRGDSVAAMSSMGTSMPFFPDIAAPAATTVPTTPATPTVPKTSTTVVAPPAVPVATVAFADNAGSSQDDEARAVAVDSQGNSYVVGTWFYADGAGDSNVTNHGDIYLAKFDVSGNLLWQLDIGGAGDDRGLAIAIDSADNLYITGMFQKIVDFDPGAGVHKLTSHGGFDIFVAKYDTDGNYQWAQGYGGARTVADVGYGIAVDAANNVLVTGQFAGSLAYDPNHPNLKLTGGGTADIFILKLAADGTTLWAKRVGGLGADRADAITTDAANNIYLTGSFSGTVDFDPGAGVAKLSSAGSTDVFILQLSATGDFSLARRMGGKAADEGTSLAVDGSGDVYVTGNFAGTMDVDPGTAVRNIVSAGSNDVFIVELNASGGLVFGERVGGSGDDRARDMVRLSNGEVAITGSFSGKVDFDPSSAISTASSAGGDDLFVLSLNADGSFNSLTDIGESGADRGRGLAVDQDDNLYVVGQCSGSIVLQTDNGSETLKSKGGRDVFLAKLS